MRTDLFVGGVVQPILDKVKLVASGGIEMLGVYLRHVSRRFERPPPTSYDLGSRMADDCQRRFKTPKFAMQKALPAAMQSARFGSPIGNGQCMLLSVMMLLVDCRDNDNDAALWLRARAVFELIDNVRWYGELGGVEFVRDVLLSLLQQNDGSKVYGFDWPEHNTLFVLANVVGRPIVVVEQHQRSSLAAAVDEQQQRVRSSKRLQASDDLRNAERHCVFLPLRTIVDASIPPAVRPTRLYLWHGNDDYENAIANHFRPMSFVNEAFAVHARHLTLKADELTTPFVENDWCEARESMFDELIGKRSLFGMSSW